MRQGYWVGCMVPLGNWMRRHSCPAAVSRSASLAVPRSPASSRSKAISTRRTPQRWKVAELQDKTESLAMSHDTFSRNTRAQLKQVFDALRELMTPATPPPLPKRPIGFLPLEDTQDKPKGAKAARGKNVKAMIDADMAFHDAIYTASGNPLIGQSALQHWRHLRRVMGAVLREERQREAVWDEHEAIANAISAGDADAAVRLIEQHSQHAGGNLAARLTHVLKSSEGDKR